MTRRVLWSRLSVLAAFPKILWTATQEDDPWMPSELIQPAQLAEILKSGSAAPHIICVAFPVLYRTRHIAGAEFAGPTSKPDGVESLRQAAAKLPKSADIVIYCGCCPMVRCPNIRPAYRELKELGYAHRRVLLLTDSFHQDWEARGYPVEPASPVTNP